MKLLELYVENFGKLKEKRIIFSDGINLIYGENESGKSTVHAFLEAMLFGMERARGRKAANDAFSRYEPWEGSGHYAGRLRFESGGKQFLLSREFGRSGKKAELICENDGETLSVEDGDLEMLLGGFTRQVYENTVSIGQLQAQPGQPLAAELKNYATNYYASGDSELDLEAAFRYLSERRKEIDKEIQEDFRKKQVKREKAEQEASFIWREMHRLEEEQEKLEEEIEYHRAGLEKEERLETVRVIDELRPGKWRIHPVEIIVFILAVALTFVLIPKPWGYLFGVILAILCLIYVWNRMKIGKKKPSEDGADTPEKETLERLVWQQERGQEEWKEKQVQYSNLREQLAEMDEMGESFWEQERQREAIDLAVEKLRELSEQMQKQMRQELNVRVSEILCRITDGKYTRIFVEDVKISVLYEERKIPVERLSRGTAEQIYFALRMAAAEFLQEEEQPVLLDDTFAYYDDHRLGRTLGWLADSKKQVLLFTCQGREETVMKNLEIMHKRVEF